MAKSALLTPVLLASITAVTALLPVSSAYAACNDCGWLYVRCMRTADTTEKAQACEESRQLCEETFCTNPLAVRLSLPATTGAGPAPTATRGAARSNSSRSLRRRATGTRLCAPAGSERTFVCAGIANMRKTGCLTARGPHVPRRSRPARSIPGRRPQDVTAVAAMDTRSTVRGRRPAASLDIVLHL